MKNLLCLVAVGLGLASCQLLGGNKSESLLPTLPQDPLIQVYFNQSQASEYQEPYRHINRRGDDLEALVVEAIESAQSSIAVAVQEIRLPRVAQALIDQHRAGIQVQIIIEDTYNQSLPELMSAQTASSEEDDRDANKAKDLLALVDRNQDGQASTEELLAGDAIYMLRQESVPLIDDRADGSKGSGLMHHKFLIIDDRVVITGSANLTPSGVHGDMLAPETRGNANHLLKIESPAFAQIFREEFNLLWGDGPGGQPDSRFGLQKPKRSPQSVPVGETIVTVNFSPSSPKAPWEQSTNGLIAQTVTTAKEEANLALFVFSEQGLANALQNAAQQGAAVRLLIDPSFAFQDYSEGLDLLGVVLPNRNCKVEANNAPWVNPVTTVGIPTLPQGDKLHHKFAVLDQQTVITGSHNWSASANYKNDETLLVFTNAIVAAHFQREFDRLYETASLGLSTSLQQTILERQEKCGL